MTRHFVEEHCTKIGHAYSSLTRRLTRNLVSQEVNDKLEPNVFKTNLKIESNETKHKSSLFHQEDFKKEVSSEEGREGISTVQSPK